MTTIDLQRRFYAEEIETTSNLQNPAVVEALASVAREQFLPPGPWTIRGEADFQSPPRKTADADPRRVYHNVAIAIDPARMLFNGAPGLLATAIDRLGLTAGMRVLHVGTGTGYYTAVMAHCVGPTGRVVGIEVDEPLAAAARQKLASTPWVEMRLGNGAGPFDESFDAVLINAGVTHPLPEWIDALASSGRMVLPLTATMPQMGTIGKGPLVMLERTADTNVLDARVITFVAIYSAVGLRDDSVNTALGMSLAKNPFPPIKSLHREPHDPSPACWLHTATCCFRLGISQTSERML